MNILERLNKEIGNNDNSKVIDLGDINLSVLYQKVFGRVRQDKSDYRWLSTYQIDMKNFSINQIF